MVQRGCRRKGQRRRRCQDCQNNSSRFAQTFKRRRRWQRRCLGHVSACHWSNTSDTAAFAGKGFVVWMKWIGWRGLECGGVMLGLLASMSAIQWQMILCIWRREKKRRKKVSLEAIQSSAQISSSLTPSLEGAAAEAEAAAASVATASPPTKRPRTDMNSVQTPLFEMDPSLNLEERW